MINVPFSDLRKCYSLAIPDVFSAHLLKGVAMNRSASAITFLSFIFILLCSFTVSATEQGQQRREARDTRQDTREASRHVKQTCVVNNNQSNHDCRQDKRQMKQAGRQKARDIKY